MPSSNRGMIFSGTGRGFSWYTTADGRTDGWQGVTVEGEKLWVDWRIGDSSKWLQRSTFPSGQINERSYSLVVGKSRFLYLTEIDSVEEYIRVNFHTQPTDTIFRFRILFSDNSWQIDTLSSDSSVIAFSSPNCTKSVAAVRHFGKWRPVTEWMDTPCGLKDFAPAELHFSTNLLPAIPPDFLPADPGLVITYANTSAEAMRIAIAKVTREKSSNDSLRKNVSRDSSINRKKNKLLFSSLDRIRLRSTKPPNETALRTLASSLRWSKSSLQGFLKADKTQIWAGYPWFAEAWGRDTFISLFGACLVQGDYETARKILITFAQWVDRNPKSPTFGRVPNRANPREIVYNTADGTAWWVKALYEYGLYSGDYGLWKDVLRNPAPADTGTHFGALRVIMAGSILRASKDSSAFQEHGEQETWMDAYSPPKGAWTPRDKYAVEVQALWAAQLQAAISMVEMMEPDSVLKVNVKRWRGAYQTLSKSFVKRFKRPDSPLLYDRIRPDGTPDEQVRPNQFFAITVPYYPLLPDSIAEPMVWAAFEELVSPFGVMSLSPNDSNFHPYHMYPAYPKDAAYHNGVIWTWLSGPVKTALCKYGQWELAWSLQQREAELMLEHSQVYGTLPELLDATSRDYPLNPADEMFYYADPPPSLSQSVTKKNSKNASFLLAKHFPNQSGTVSQTWSLAEFQRSFWQDFFGVRPVQGNQGRVIWKIDPHLNPDWGEVNATVNMQGHLVDISCEQIDDTTKVLLTAQSIADSTAIFFKLFGEPGVSGALNEARKPVLFQYQQRTGEVWVDGKPAAITAKHPPADTLWHFAKVKVRKDLPSLQPPSWQRVGSKEGTVWRENAAVKRNAIDETNDELKQGYTYPTDSRFVKGIFDISSATISEDNERVYFSLKFKKLTQPGWHPEYGFQLTFAAIAIETGSRKTSAKKLGMNGQYIFPTDFQPDRLLYIGGGFRLTDGNDKTMYECVADDAAYPLGSPATNEVRVSVPRSLLPNDPAKWKIHIYSGGQDDHGGAGMGEFRSVYPEASQWHGGGNTSGNGTNVYDVLEFK
ncbi:MAG: hypothetical protein OEM52_12145 [bacterium]|nr:hypothetical protein [bacterium]